MNLLLAGFLGGIILIILFLFLYPIQINSLILNPKSSQSYEESRQRIDDLNKKDPPAVDPLGKTILMDHGHKTRRVIVFFHGFTNSPRQFKALAEEFYKQGDNVFIPRIPYHGFKEPLASNLEQLTAEDLVIISSESIDIAQGLGEKVIVVGISMGGIMAGWAAQMRADIDKAVLIAPNFGIYKVPEYLSKPLINFLVMKPNFFIWWDAHMKKKLKLPEITYHGFSSRAMGEVRRLGWFVKQAAKKFSPQAKAILVISNANDRAVSQEGIDVMMDYWQRQSHQQVEYYQFPRDLNLGHDLIDPQQPDQNIAEVYPKILWLIRKDV